MNFFLCEAQEWSFLHNTFNIITNNYVKLMNDFIFDITY